MTGLQGTSLTKEEKEFIISNHIAGIILFKRNIQSFQQIYELCAEIKSLTKPAPLIAMDMEGGEVNRFSHLKESFLWPSPRVLRTLGLEQVSSIACSMAQQLDLLGIDINFAPVVDQLITDFPLLKNRIWGETQEEIVKYAGAFLKGLEEGKVISCLKHFPGHGGVNEDSHRSLPQDYRTLVDIESQLDIFQILFNKYPCWIMTAHIEFSKIDKRPATFSSLLLKKELRNRRGFKNIVVSDDIDMEALKSFSSGEKFFYALKGGCDLVLICQKEETSREIIIYFEKYPKKKEELEAEITKSSKCLLEIREERNRSIPSFKNIEKSLLQLKN